MDIRQKALEFATAAHAGQVRKGSGLPYIAHPIAVAELALTTLKLHSSEYSIHTLQDKIYAVALLHDTLEDCDSVTYDTLAESFELSITICVELLTKREGDSYLDSILRVKGCEIATAVKIADLTHNMSDLHEVSLKEKYRLAKYILENL